MGTDPGYRRYPLIFTQPQQKGELYFEVIQPFFTVFISATLNFPTLYLMVYKCPCALNLSFEGYKLSKSVQLPSLKIVKVSMYKGYSYRTHASFS
jgi:hypothetical protein